MIPWMNTLSDDTTIQPVSTPIQIPLLRMFWPKPLLFPSSVTPFGTFISHIPFPLLPRTFGVREISTTTFIFPPTFREPTFSFQVGTVQTRISDKCTFYNTWAFSWPLKAHKLVFSSVLAVILRFMAISSFLFLPTACFTLLLI